MPTDIEMLERLRLVEVTCPEDLETIRHALALIERYRMTLEQINVEGRALPPHGPTRQEAWDAGNAAGLYRAGEHARAVLAPDPAPKDGGVKHI